MTLFAPKPVTTAFSPTKLQAWLWCPYQYKLVHRLGLAQKTVSTALVRGTIGHKMVETASDQSLTFKKVFDEGVKYFKSGREGEWDADKAAIDKMEAELTEMLTNYYNRCLSMGLEVKTQESWRAFQFHTYDFEGTVDLYFKLPDTPDGMLEATDFKFGKKQANNELNRNIQFGLYWLSDQKRGVQVNRFYYIHMQDFLAYKSNCKSGKKGEVKGPGFYPIKITKDDIETIHALVQPIITSIQAGIYPVKPGDNCRTCQFTNHCPRFKIGVDPEEVGDLEF